MRAISVKFDGYDSQYTYLTYDPTIKVGDECLANWPLLSVYYLYLNADMEVDYINKESK